MQLTEEYILTKLREAETESSSSDGYAEIAPKPNASYRCAAVLAPLVYIHDEWHLLFTRRAEHVASHKGQVSFPGGACEDGETTPEETALREAEEEIGMRPQDVKILGRLSRLVTVTSFRVSPIVGVIPWPYTFRVECVEVARVFTMPLLWLANKNNYWEFFRRDSDRSVIVYHPFDGEILWGATARITVNFLKAIEMLHD